MDFSSFPNIALGRCQTYAQVSLENEGLYVCEYLLSIGTPFVPRNLTFSQWLSQDTSKYVYTLSGFYCFYINKGSLLAYG